ncbi:MAG: hypothetical protein IPK62_06255 [Bacteroidetes bacterium]|nr:hypothetical protein [Bacteroidota bacterium]MBK8144617.1 hypothetical protein [Bacteroidota bacterium]
MTKNKMLLASLLIITGMFSCTQKKYTKLKSGLEYLIVKDEKGDKKTDIGSIISLHILTKIGDSVLFDSRKITIMNRFLRKLPSHSIMAI